MSVDSANLKVRELIPEDSPILVNIHPKIFPDSIFTAFGANFMLSALFPLTYKNANIKGYVLLYKERVIGYAIIERQRGTVFRQLKRRIVPAMAALVQNPLRIVVLMRYLRATFHPKIIIPEQKISEACMNIVLIGIIPDFQGRGVGSFFVNALNRAAANNFGIFSCTISTYSDKAVKLYLRNGYKLIGEELHAQKTFWTFRKDNLLE